MSKCIESIKGFFKKKKVEEPEQVDEVNVNENGKKKGSKFSKFFSVPLLKQSIKANWVLWLILSVGAALIFIIINVALGGKKVFVSIDMNAVSAYVVDENMSWLQILGLLDIMGFKLNQIQLMSQIDINSIMNDLIYKIAGVLLPMIYVMIVGNRLLASQVNDGSMAYVLSTPTARKKVIRTQWFFLATTLTLMYIIVFLGAYISGALGNMVSNQYPASTYALRTFLLCFSSYCSIFFLMGLCFGASAIFNKASQSIAIGGGACVLAFLCCILGLFANKVFIATGIGVKEMDIFNYLSVFTLVDTDSLSQFCQSVTGYPDVVPSYDWLWKDAISFGVGLAFSLFGGIWFTKKDLPL